MMSFKCHTLFLLMMWCSKGIDGQILSRNRSVYMSSKHSDWSGDRVVDGDYRQDAGSCGCCAATTTETDPWITIDLGNTYLITRISVYGRTDQDNQNLNGLVFKLDDTRFNPATNSTPILSYTFILDRPTATRNVTLILPRLNKTLVLCEFDVFNDNIISINKPITASSQFSPNWPIQGAVDGNNTSDGNACRCCAATKPEDNPWMYVDLGGYFYITYIIIYGRTDDTPSNQLFHGLEIEAGNGNIINVPDTDNFYDSGAMRVGPATYVKLQLNGIWKLLIVCELQVFGVCQAGTYGTSCEYTCGQCRNGANCNPTDGVCQQCEDGFSEADKTCKTPCTNSTYGINCTGVCGHCKNGAICNKTNGICDQYEDGYMQTDMLCVKPCVGGTYGHNCTGVCGHCKNGAICNKTNGVCDQCVDGYMKTDMLCVQPCVDETYGHNCTGVFGHCKNGAICNKATGLCDQCENGYMETDMVCAQPCENGTYGNNCTGVCGHCKNGAICNKTNGVCDQCEDGYLETDMLCMETAENVSRSLTSCPISLASPDSPDIMMIVGVTVAAMLAIEGAAVVIICLIRKRKSLRKDNVGEPNPYEIPNRSINEDEHQYDSAMDMNVETQNYVNTGHRAI